MGAKAEISWKGRTMEGLQREVYAQRVGGEWRFYVREQRYERWQPLPDPAAPLAAGGRNESEKGYSGTVSGSRVAMKPRALVLITPCHERQGAEFLDRSLSLSDHYPRAV